MHQSQVKLFLLLLHKGQASSDELIVGFSSFSSWKYSAIVTSVLASFLPSFPAFFAEFWFWRLTAGLLRARETTSKVSGCTHKKEQELEEDAMFQRIREWLSLKNYQYQVTTGIYMLEPWERTIFSILFGIDCCNIYLHLLSTKHHAVNDRMDDFITVRRRNL